MKRKRTNNNLKWQLAELEAKAGLAPRLITVKKAQQAKAKKSTDDTIDIDTVSPVDQSEIMEQIDKLKTERFNRKMFKVHKELLKTVKIARNREIQRLVKKLKTVRHLLSNMEDKMRTEFGISQFTQDVFDGVPDALLKSYRKQRGRAQQSENQLEQLKQLTGLQECGEAMLKRQLSQSSYLRENPVIQNVVLKTEADSEITATDPNTTAPSIAAADTALLNESKPFKDWLNAAVVDLEVYLKSMDESIPRAALQPDLNRRNEILKKRVVHNNNNDSDKQDLGDSADDENDDKDDAITDSENEIDDSSSFGDPFDGDDGYEALQNGADGKRKKNRPGQQARRQKWERLYGNQANHVVKEQQQQQQQQPWTSRQQKQKRPEHSTSFKRKPAAGEPSEDSQNLHPSWEAKRRQREQLQLQTAQPCGKKIVFDD